MGTSRCLTTPLLIFGLLALIGAPHATWAAGGELHGSLGTSFHLHSLTPSGGSETRMNAATSLPGGWGLSVGGSRVQRLGLVSGGMDIGVALPSLVVTDISLAAGLAPSSSLLPRWHAGAHLAFIPLFPGFKPVLTFSYRSFAAEGPTTGATWMGGAVGWDWALWRFLWSSRVEGASSRWSAESVHQGKAAGSVLFVQRLSVSVFPFLSASASFTTGREALALGAQSAGSSPLLGPTPVVALGAGLGVSPAPWIRIQPDAGYSYYSDLGIHWWKAGGTLEFRW